MDMSNNGDYDYTEELHGIPRHQYGIHDMHYDHRIMDKVLKTGLCYIDMGLGLLDIREVGL